MSRKKINISELDLSTVGGRIAHARISKGLTKSELAKKIGTSKSSVTSWEANSYKPGSEYLLKISELTEAESDWLINGERKGASIHTRPTTMDDGKPDKWQAMKLLEIIFDYGNEAAIRTITGTLNFFSAAVIRAAGDRRKTDDPKWIGENDRRKSIAGG